MQTFRTLTQFFLALLLFAAGTTSADSLPTGTTLASGLYVEVRGKGQPVLMIPGLNSAAATWDQTCQALQSDGLACHLVQLPGFAGQKASSYDDFLGSMTAALLAYIDEADLEQPVIMGHSLGGFLAMKMAIEAEPNQLGSLIIVDSLPFLPAAFNEALSPESAKPFAESMRENMLVDDEDARAASIRHSATTMTRDPERVNTLLQWGLASDAHTSAQAMYELMTQDLRPQLSHIQQPVLILGAWAAYQNYGATKESTRSRFERQYANMPQFTLAFSDAGYHFLMWDDPEWLLDEVRHFLQ
ncbi:alpha/beta fold hydrolase [Marinimicrobium sp. ABcell2]|uniref:alpha/beta fold hydrolase n=1 Tax=Marinimicrobium sp. ABcell2 TaxID=3069751 RepID=UPI0027B2434D|nr:alpha/beta hydrolase [Marinimicrobium sp. ABcell2]MDQ2077652.1 alpha/beta hydrolase [Marinimicrobium sp. ABcell2]